MNPFMPDRSAGCEGVRHIPYPPQGSTLIDSGGTPQDFMAQPVAMSYGQEVMPIEWNAAQPPDLDPSRELLAQGIGIDFLGTIPSVANFPPGPGDMDRNEAGWE